MKINKREIIIAVIFVILGFFMGMEYKAYQIASIIQNGITKMNNSIPNIDVEKDNSTKIIDKSIGDLVELATLEIKINKIEETTTLHSKYSQPKVAHENAKFIIIDLNVINTTTSPFTHSDNWLVIVDEKWRIFNPFDSISSIDNYLNMRELAPGISENGKMIYEVPSDSNKFYFLIKKAGTKEEYHIALN